MVALRASPSSAPQDRPSGTIHRELAQRARGGMTGHWFEHPTCAAFSLPVVSPLSVGGRPPSGHGYWGVSVPGSWFVASSGPLKALSAGPFVTASASPARDRGFGRPPATTESE